ncbi:MAG: Glu-tRNA(Gln) amidotransferase subunit GatD [Thaumarchaeota archaeon]|nr:Glu-tRNA(Gln) amidotransferase subunit GatD [Nitrososphaerota archaeon]
MGDLEGYRGQSLTALEAAGVSIGDFLSLEVDGQSVMGTLAPRYAHDDDSHIVIKLKSGYNVGLSVAKVTKVSRLAKGERPSFTSSNPKTRGDLLEVAILGTGGTIASRVEYRTGAVQPAISSEDLYSLIPELSDIARIRTEVILTVASEDLEPEHWGKMAEKVAERVAEGARGVVVTTGTDVMGYTSAALAFALQGVPVPVFVVGSQRSSDRPSSDAYLNLIGAVTLAVAAEFAGVYLVMHADSSDELLAIHRATRVRKNHASARDAFESIGIPPEGYWTRKGPELISKSLPPRARAEKFVPKPLFDPNVALVKFYPSMPTSLLEAQLASGLKGLIIEGTGLGHVNRKNIAVIQRFIAGGGLAFMTSQCIWGRVDLNVYANGRDLLQAGVVPLEDMLAETALVKLMWTISNTASAKEAEGLMRKNLAGEVTERSFPSGQTA